MTWVSANDPLLDDSVDFNTRLRRVGVNSQIRATRNMPHAFLGLKNAGFPEALEVHASCIDWLNNVFGAD